MLDVGVERNLVVQRQQVPHVQRVNVVVSVDAGQRFQFAPHSRGEIDVALHRQIDVEALAQFRILGGDAHRAPARVADAVLLAADGDHRGGGQRHGVGTHGQGLGDVGAVAESAGDAQGHLAAVMIEETPRPAQGEDRRQTDVVLHEIGSRPGAAAAAIDGDEIGLRGQRHGQVRFDSPGGELDPDGSSAGHILQLGHPLFQILRRVDSRMPPRRMAVPVHGNAADGRDLLGDLGLGQMFRPGRAWRPGRS